MEKENELTEKEKQEQWTQECEQARETSQLQEREEVEATHMPFRDWCTHCMMGGGRTHHHVSKQWSENLSGRPVIAMDYHFLEPNSTVSSQTIPEESVTCISVREDIRTS